MRFATLLLLLTMSLTFAEDSARDLKVTIYNDNLGLVTDTRQVQVKKGLDTIAVQDIPRRINPLSVRFSCPNAELIEQRYDSTWSKPPQSWAGAYVGKRIEVDIADGSRVEGTLLSANFFASFSNMTFAVQRDDSSLLVIPLAQISRLSLPGIQHSDSIGSRLIWIIDSQSDDPQSLELSYLTSGMSWSAEYIAFVRTGTDDVEFSGWTAILNRSGMDMNNASVKTVAGELHRVRRQGDYHRVDVAAQSVRAESLAEPHRQFTERSLSEYHLYELNRRTTLGDGTTTQISLLPITKVKTRRIYEYDPERDENGVSLVLDFSNSEKNGIGFPLPAGVVRVYQEDTDHTQQFIGEDTIRHTPKDDRVSVRIGQAYDIAVERVQTDYRQSFYHQADVRYEVRLQNHRSSPVEVRVVEHTWGNTQVVYNSHEYEKVSARRIEFPVTCAPDSQTVVSYTIRY